MNFKNAYGVANGLCSVLYKGEIICKKGYDPYNDGSKKSIKKRVFADEETMQEKKKYTDALYIHVL